MYRVRAIYLRESPIDALQPVVLEVPINKLQISLFSLREIPARCACVCYENIYADYTVNEVEDTWYRKNFIPSPFPHNRRERIMRVLIIIYICLLLYKKKTNKYNDRINE